jgi:hypothetical protein
LPQRNESPPSEPAGLTLLIGLQAEASLHPMDIDWRPLIAVSSDSRRRAIYGETFPAELERAFALHPEARPAFDQAVAEDILQAFADGWPDLDTDPQRRFRWYLKGFPTKINPDVVVGFFGDELTPELIVVAGAEAFHH